MEEFSRHHLHFTAETSMPKRKYQGMVRGRLPTQYVLNERLCPIVFHACWMPVSEGIRQELFMVVPHVSSRYD
jgi:hypothetical protein